MKEVNGIYTIRCPCCNEMIEVSMSGTGEITGVFFHGQIRDIELGSETNGGDQ